MLEDYRYHTGLNFISGLNMFLLGDFDNSDGRERLRSAFEKIRKYDDSQKNFVLDETLDLVYKHKSDILPTALEELSEILCFYYLSYDHWSKIYAKLQDKTSLTSILDYELNRLANIGRN